MSMSLPSRVLVLSLSMALAGASSVSVCPTLAAPQSANQSYQQPTNQKISREEALKIARTQVPGSQHSTTIPKNFPVPVYTSNVSKTNFIHSTKGNPSASANIITSDDVRALPWDTLMLVAGGLSLGLATEIGFGSTSDSVIAADTIDGYAFGFLGATDDAASSADQQT